MQDLKQRIVEGIITAKTNGKMCGRAIGSKIITRKSIQNKEKIIKLSKTFNGNLKDREVLDLLNIDRTTYYRYKRQIKEEIEKRH